MSFLRAIASAVLVVTASPATASDAGEDGREARNRREAAESRAGAAVPGRGREQGYGTSASGGRSDPEATRCDCTCKHSPPSMRQGETQRDPAQPGPLFDSGG